MKPNDTKADSASEMERKTERDRLRRKIQELEKGIEAQEEEILRLREALVRFRGSHEGSGGNGPAI